MSAHRIGCPRPLRAALLAVAVAVAGLVPACVSSSAPGPRHIPAGRRGVFQDRFDVTVFQRGNVHTHTRESDGDSHPEAVVAWYRDHGYNFLAVSDHKKLTDPNRFRALERPGFVLISGEEITSSAGRIPVHVNALCHRRAVGGRRFALVEDALRWSVEQTHAQGGVALVNHPNFKWAFGAEALTAAAGAKLLEVWSGFPASRSDGDAAHPSVEAMWDSTLTMGMDFAAVAVDDMHNLGAIHIREKPGPGRGWVDVFAYHASEREICDALARGWLIASNGVRLGRITVQGDSFSVVPFAPGGQVDFIGREGKVLARQRVDPSGRPNVYRLRGGEDYVRAKVTAPNGACAWTQAYRVDY